MGWERASNIYFKLFYIVFKYSNQGAFFENLFSKPVQSDNFVSSFFLYQMFKVKIRLWKVIKIIKPQNNIIDVKVKKDLNAEFFLLLNQMKNSFAVQKYIITLYKHFF